MNTESPDYIAVTPGMVSATLDLRRTTALAGCTMVDALPDSGQIKVVRQFARLSSGEELLWQVLAWLSGQAGLPSIDDLRAGLDVGNYAAVSAVLDAEGVAS